MANALIFIKFKSFSYIQMTFTQCSLPLKTRLEMHWNSDFFLVLARNNLIQEDSEILLSLLLFSSFSQLPIYLC